MECKVLKALQQAGDEFYVLIETLWNVKTGTVSKEII